MSTDFFLAQVMLIVVIMLHALPAEGIVALGADHLLTAPHLLYHHSAIRTRLGRQDCGQIVGQALI